MEPLGSVESCHSTAKLAPTHTHLQGLLHFCLGAFALASETFFPLPLLGWMALWSAQSAPPQGGTHSCPHPPPL